MFKKTGDAVTTGKPVEYKELKKDKKKEEKKKDK